MSKFVRLVYHNLKDFFVSNTEDSCDSSNQFQDSTPYPFADCNLVAVLVCQSEDFADSFVCHKPLHDRDHVVLQRNKRCTGNLGGKVAGLTLAKAKQSLALLEDDLQRPSSWNSAFDMTPQVNFKSRSFILNVGLDIIIASNTTVGFFAGLGCTI